jgi:hypothetical protein
MRENLRRTVERAIAALRTLAHDLEHEPAPGEDTHRHEQRVADRLRGIAEALALAAEQLDGRQGEGKPATPLDVPQESSSQRQRHLDAMHTAAMRAHLRRTTRPKSSQRPEV